MSDSKQTIEPAKGTPQPQPVARTPQDKPVWETPTLEDVVIEHVRRAQHAAAVRTGGETS